MSWYRVEWAVRAQRQLAATGRWWRENRSTPLLDHEVSAALMLLAQHPYAGAPAAKLQGVRQLLLRRTQYVLFYRIDQAESVVHIVAFWHTARSSGPPLR